MLIKMKIMASTTKTAMPFQLDTSRCTVPQPSYGAVPGVVGTGHIRLLCPPHMVAAAIFWDLSGPSVTCCLLYWLSLVIPALTSQLPGSPMCRLPSTVCPRDSSSAVALPSFTICSFFWLIWKKRKKCEHEPGLNDLCYTTTNMALNYSLSHKHGFRITASVTNISSSAEESHCHTQQQCSMSVIIYINDISNSHLYITYTYIAFHIKDI